MIRADRPSPRIRLEEVSKSYRRRRGGRLDVLTGLNLEIDPRRVMTIVGPSGCGKSTILKLIAGLSPLSGGRISFEPAAERPRVGFLFQDYTSALAPWRTVIKNVELGLEIEGELSPGERRETSLAHLERVGLKGVENSYPRELSGGMQQRVQIARVLAYAPNVLLMDEPFGSLDAQMRRLLQVDLRRILDETHQTVVFVTHDIDEALYLGDRVIVLSRPPTKILLDLSQGDRPDHYEEFVRTNEYPELHRQIWSSLRDELGVGDAY